MRLQFRIPRLRIWETLRRNWNPVFISAAPNGKRMESMKSTIWLRIRLKDAAWWPARARPVWFCIPICRNWATCTAGWAAAASPTSVKELQPTRRPFLWRNAPFLCLPSARLRHALRRAISCNAEPFQLFIVNYIKVINNILNVSSSFSLLCFLFLLLNERYSSHKCQSRLPSKTRSSWWNSWSGGEQKNVFLIIKRMNHPIAIIIALFLCLTSGRDPERRIESAEINEESSSSALFRIDWSQLFSRSTVTLTRTSTLISYMTCPPTIATTYITVTNTSRMDVFITCTLSTTACSSNSGPAGRKLADQRVSPSSVLVKYKQPANLIYSIIIESLFQRWTDGSGMGVSAGRLADVQRRAPIFRILIDVNFEFLGQSESSPGDYWKRRWKNSHQNIHRHAVRHLYQYRRVHSIVLQPRPAPSMPKCSSNRTKLNKNY